MKTLFLRLLFAYIMATFLIVPAYAQEQERLTEIHDGLTKTDLTGDGVPEIVLKAWRENFNAHGYYVIQLLKLRGNSTNSFDIIGIDYGSDVPIPFAHELQSRSTADRITQDQRFVYMGKQAFLIEATLSQKGSCCADVPVTFRFFKMSYNREGVPGTTQYYFELTKEWTTANAYPDLNQAFRQNSEKLISELQ